MPRKQRTARVSSIAGRVAGMTDAALDRAIAVNKPKVYQDVRTMALALVSQDELRGQNRPKGPARETK